MGRHSDPSSSLFWLGLVAAIVVIALFFRPVRVWLWGTWFKFKGILLARRAKHYTDTRRTGAELDHNFHDIKEHYLKWTLRDIERWTRGPQKRLLKRLGTLRKFKEQLTAERAHLETELKEEQRNTRDRPRIKGPLYYILATFLALGDIAITFVCLQALNYPVIFMFPSAVLLGLVGFVAGDFLGKNIEPAQKNPDKEKNRRTIALLAVFSGLYCIVFGTMRFLYTQHDSSVSPALDFVGSYGFISIIVGCSVMLGWMYVGITTEERLAYVKARLARIEVSIDRCDKHGAKMTEAFRAHLLALESESALIRSQFRGGFDSAWLGRAPYGVESPASPLEYDEDMFKGLTWPDPPSGTVKLQVRPAKVAEYSKYDEPTPLLAQPHPAPPRPSPSAVPRPAPSRPARQISPPASTSFQDDPPPIG